MLEGIERIMPVIVCPNGNKILLDEADYDKAKAFKWLAYNYENDDAKVFTLSNKKRTSMSKLVFGISGQQCIYHKNGNPFDFRRKNLVICNNKSEFAQISFPRLNKTSKYNNVYWNTQTSKWVARVMLKGKSIHGGYYIDEYDAAIVADYMINLYYGKSIKLNFLELTEDELREKHNEVLKKHGVTAEEKYAKCHQGISSKSEKLSPYVGVYYDSRHQYWAARLTFCKKTHYKRGFKSDTEAALAYDQMALWFYGGNARLNFPRG